MAFSAILSTISCLRKLHRPTDLEMRPSLFSGFEAQAVQQMEK